MWKLTSHGGGGGEVRSQLFLSHKTPGGKRAEKHWRRRGRGRSGAERRKTVTAANPHIDFSCDIFPRTRRPLKSNTRVHAGGPRCAAPFGKHSDKRVKRSARDLCVVSCAAARSNLVSARGLHMILSPRSARLVPRELTRARHPRRASRKRSRAWESVAVCQWGQTRNLRGNLRGNLWETSALRYYNIIIKRLIPNAIIV